MSDSAGEKTEKATPKKRDEARKKGSVARSADANGAAVLLTALGVLAAAAPFMYGRLEASMRHGLTLISTPSVVSHDGLGELFKDLGITVALVVGPIAGACMLAGVAISILQVKWKPSAQALKPDPKSINPLSGAKNLFGKRAIFETAKNIAKVAVVGSVVLMAILPNLQELAALVGMQPSHARRRARAARSSRSASARPPPTWSSRPSTTRGSSTRTRSS